MWSEFDVWIKLAIQQELGSLCYLSKTSLYEFWRDFIWSTRLFFYNHEIVWMRYIKYITVCCLVFEVTYFIKWDEFTYSLQCGCRSLHPKVLNANQIVSYVVADRVDTFFLWYGVYGHDLVSSLSSFFLSSNELGFLCFWSLNSMELYKWTGHWWKCEVYLQH